MALSRSNSLRLVLALWLAVPFLAAAHAQESAGGPLEVIRSSNERVLEIYAGATTIDETAEAQIFAVMAEVTSFETLASATIDGFCERTDEATCAEFEDVFVELLRISAVNRLGRYSADRFEYLAEEIDGDVAIVRTLAYYEGDNVELDYHLRPIDGRWMIVNYVVDGVDTIRNYRKQFTRLLGDESVGDVIERLRRRIAEYQSTSPR